MNLIRIMHEDNFGGEALISLTETEVKKYLDIMKKIKAAAQGVLFEGKLFALRELNYKEDITFEDGTILTKAWPASITKEDDGTFSCHFDFYKREHK